MVDRAQTMHRRPPSPTVCQRDILYHGRYRLLGEVSFAPLEMFAGRASRLSSLLTSLHLEAVHVRPPKQEGPFCWQHCEH